MTEPTVLRWHATITYRSDDGPLDVDYAFEELEDLHDIVERGPDWNTIERVEVTLARKSSPALTLEDSRTR